MARLEIWKMFLLFVAVVTVINLSYFKLNGDQGPTDHASEQAVLEQSRQNEQKPSLVAMQTTIPSLEHMIQANKLWDALIMKEARPGSYMPGKWGITSPMYQNKKIEVMRSRIEQAYRDGLKIETVCEVGVLACVASFMFFQLAPRITWYGFDMLMDLPDATNAGVKFLKLVADKPDKVIFTEGDSKITIPDFAKKNPNVTCDVVFLDGGKSYDLRMRDLMNFRSMSHEKTIVFMDEVTNFDCVFNRGDTDKVCHVRGWGAQWIGCSLAYRAAVRNKVFETTYCPDKEILYGDSFCAGRYLFDDVRIRKS
jgi:hypothetical protein